MTDTKLAVKENEALLTLAVNLYHKGDIDRAYNYIKVALDDAIFYNSRFKNTVIARIHPIIENTYLYRLEEQKRNLRFYILLTSLFVVALAITLYFTYKQTKIVSRAKRHLKTMNEELIGLNKNLDEANLIKEKYVGYFMNQCAVYINKLDEYRKNVNRKIKTVPKSRMSLKNKAKTKSRKPHRQRKITMHKRQKQQKIIQNPKKRQRTNLIAKLKKNSMNR